MNTKTISERALSVIDQYTHFKFGAAVCSVPYFNNKTIKARAALRTFIGKGSPEDIIEEVQNITVKDRTVPETVSDEALKKILVDNNLGIECSGFAYYVLNAESQALNKGDLSKRLSFPYCRGLLGKLRCAIRPIENCNVVTFAHEKNSREILLKDVHPGDIITMIGDPEESEHDHILVIHQIEYQHFIPTKIYYCHAVAYPEDGIYGSGVRQGIISITDINKSIAEQSWSEEGKEGEVNRLFIRAQKSKTEIRRLNWF